MKKTTSVLIATTVLLALNGCGGGGGDSSGGLTTLFLVDENGVPYENVLYQCDSMAYPVLTTNGEFTFFPGEECLFDFYGYNGTGDPDPYLNDYMYIVDVLDGGKNNIPYECKDFNVGVINYTYDDSIYDGAFDYDYDDQCVFYL